MVGYVKPLGSPECPEEFASWLQSLKMWVFFFPVVLLELFPCPSKCGVRHGCFVCCTVINPNADYLMVLKDAMYLTLLNLVSG